MDNEDEEFFKNYSIINQGNHLAYKTSSGKLRNVKNTILGFDKVPKGKYIAYKDNNPYNLKKENLELRIFGHHSTGAKGMKRSSKGRLWEKTIMYHKK